MKTADDIIRLTALTRNPDTNTAEAACRLLIVRGGGGGTSAGGASAHCAPYRGDETTGWHVPGAERRGRAAYLASQPSGNACPRECMKGWCPLFLDNDDLGYNVFHGILLSYANGGGDHNKPGATSIGKPMLAQREKKREARDRAFFQ